MAKLCDVDNQSIIRGGEFGSLKLGETLMAQGFEGGELTQNGFPPEAVVLTLEYFAYFLDYSCSLKCSLPIQISNSTYLNQHFDISGTHSTVQKLLGAFS